MFWTAVVWGLGVSCGACGGVFLFLALKVALDMATGREQQKTEIWQFSKDSLDQLVERNRLTELIIRQLERIAESNEALERR